MFEQNNIVIYNWLHMTSEIASVKVKTNKKPLMKTHSSTDLEYADLDILCTVNA